MKEYPFLKLRTAEGMDKVVNILCGIVKSYAENK